MQLNNLARKWLFRETLTPVHFSSPRKKLKIGLKISCGKEKQREVISSILDMEFYLRHPLKTLLPLLRQCINTAVKIRQAMYPEIKKTLKSNYSRHNYR